MNSQFEFKIHKGYLKAKNIPLTMYDIRIIGKILQLLKEEPMTKYQVIKRIPKRSKSTILRYLNFLERGGD
jgi:predicted transcriptional regulator